MTVGEVRDLHVRKLLEYFPSDVTLCRAEPGVLADRQEKIHGPILQWARSELGPVTTSESIFGAEQVPEVVRAAEKRLRSLDAFELTAVFNSSASSKSLLTGLALIRGVIDVDQAMAAARVEEDLQIEEWGLVEGGHDVDLADIRVRLSSPRVMINLLRHR